MRIKLLTFRYSSTLGGFDDSALSEFICDKEVIAFREHFYAVNEVPHLSCVIHYQDAVVPVGALRAAATAPPATTTTTLRPTRGATRARNKVPDAAEDLDTNQRALFNHLREWRTRTAREEGLPPYVLFTNRQLAAIVRMRPDSGAALGTVDGVGSGKIERFGRGLLAALHGAPQAAAPASAAPSPSEAPNEPPTEASSDPLEAPEVAPASAATPASVESATIAGEDA